MRPVQVVDLTVALDYGQFHLSSPTQAPGHHGGEDLLTLVDEAVRGRGIAGAEGEDLVVVISPHQNNFDMRLRIEVWATEPPADLDEWRLQLWPAPSSIRPRRLRAWTDPAAALAMEGSGWPGDLDDLRAPDTIGRPDDRSS